jgi:prepilin-type N-terminal cleavage/methylation domain-containing protein
VSPYKTIGGRAWRSRQHGFSLLEMLLAIAILLVVTGIVMSAMMQMTMTQGTVANRTEMHSSVRSATELLQQEIGQAGKISLPATAVTLSAALAAPASPPISASAVLNNAAGIFPNEQLVIDTGDNEETVTVNTVVAATKTITAIFTLPHVFHAPVRVAGTFASGIVPTTAACPPPNGGAVCGSTPFILKLYGDIDDDGNMKYIEYTCDSAAGPPTTGGNLYRQVLAYDDLPTTKVSPTPSMVVLSNILPNPPDPGTTTPAPCFKYQEKPVGTDTYVVDVSVTLTVQTQNKDPQTHKFQTETKALLNVSPRNVFEGWQLASASVLNRVQPMPLTVLNLLP